MSAAPRQSRPQTHAIGQVILQNISCKFVEVNTAGVWKISNIWLWALFTQPTSLSNYRCFSQYLSSNADIFVIKFMLFYLILLSFAIQNV